MRAIRNDIVNYIDNLLDIKSIPDYGPQGLQVEGNPEVTSVVLGVSAHQELFEKAAHSGAQMIIVHHGLLWDNLPRTIVGWRKDRLKVLLNHNITLLGYHLALDKHPEVGNNAQLGKVLGLTALDQPFGIHKDMHVGWLGVSKIPVGIDELSKKLEHATHGKSQLFGFGKPLVARIGIVSGESGNANLVSEAIEVGCEAYITGVLSEESYALAKEGKLNVIAGGHYNTEKLGIIALGEKIREQFGVSVTFIDVPNPL